MGKVLNPGSYRFFSWQCQYLGGLHRYRICLEVGVGNVLQKQILVGIEIVIFYFAQHIVIKMYLVTRQKSLTSV